MNMKERIKAEVEGRRKEIEDAISIGLQEEDDIRKKVEAELAGGGEGGDEGGDGDGDGDGGGGADEDDGGTTDL